jgi:predicted patatin/cPLA2 family phospholipase
VHISILILILGLIVFAQGCASVPQRKPLLPQLGGTAQVPDIPNARIWGDEEPSYTKEWLEKTKDEIQAEYPSLIGKQHNYLAISGGGQNGAFGAGLLVGWTKAGSRPEFTMVTGISTGALMAPFAFLGPAYDKKLKEVYTTVTTKDILAKRNLLEAVSGDAAASSQPLEALLKKYINREILDAIAAEHKKGRRLWIGTTNLDAGRPVIWDIGIIATSGHPKAPDLIHKILLASASVPVAFPPVYIEVEANGSIYDEMHVDGGTTAQIFLYPSQLDWKLVLKKLEAKAMPRLYLIRNSRIKPGWITVKPELLPIAVRSIDSLIRTQGIGDIYRIYLDARSDGLDFNLAYIPDDFELKPKDVFDPTYMTQLFELGYELAKGGYPWKKEPPD